MRHLYRVVYVVGFRRYVKGKPTKRVEEFDESEMHVLGNGDAADVIAKVRKLALRDAKTIKDTDKEGRVIPGIVYKPERVRFTHVQQEVGVRA